MSDSEEKTLSVSPDQSTTGEPAAPKRKGAVVEDKNEAPPAKTIKGEKKIESDQKTSTQSYDDSYEKAICNLMENIAYKDAEMFWDIITAGIFEATRMEILNKWPEKPYEEYLDELKAMSDLKVLGEAETRFGFHFKCVLIYITSKSVMETMTTRVCVLGFVVKKSNQ